jgi:phosphoribosylformylglycinamidine cyclo-ligase
MNKPLSYKDAGVDIDAGDALVDRIKPMAKKTMRDGVLAGIGGFGALFEVPKRYKEPVLVSGTDGVGTKLRLAFALDRHDTVGIDLVAMSVNDILVQGAEPLFFLDYFACGKLDVDRAASVVSGIAKGCEISGCALIGGETAEMPDMYPAGEYDLAGFAVGAVDKSKAINGSMIEPGDVVLGLASSGPHSNGYSLIRKIIERACGEVSVSALSEDFHGKPLADWLIEPTRIYVKPMLSALAQFNPREAGEMNASTTKDAIKGMAHITGGGLVENIPRMLGEHLQVVLQGSSWSMPPIFNWLQSHGQIADHEMHRTFNCGIGMAVIVAADQAVAIQAHLTSLGEQVWAIGKVQTRPHNENGGLEHQTVVV